MRFLLFMVFIAITGSSSGQFATDSLKWQLIANNILSDSTDCAKGADQVIGTGIAVPSYSAGYQKITKPAGGWTNFPSAGNLASSPDNQYLQFPYSSYHFFPVSCSTGVGSCASYCSFMTNSIKLKGYHNPTGGNIRIQVERTGLTGIREYLGEFYITSTDPSNPTIINMPLTYGNNSANGIIFYPLGGDDFYLRDVVVSGLKGAPLPLVFTGFEGSRKNNLVQLYWMIGDAYTAERFIIEHSIDGKNFEMAATTNVLAGKLNYSWQGGDEATYFRIRAIEPSGISFYSKIIDLSRKENGDISVYPNPIHSGEVYIKTAKPLTGNASFMIVNQLGQLVISGISPAGGSVTKIRLPGLAPGIYLLKLVTGENTFLQKISIR